MKESREGPNARAEGDPCELVGEAMKAANLETGLNEKGQG
jgi:hypothetical protein